MTNINQTIGIQGGPGSYSEQAAQRLYPDRPLNYYQTFDELFAALDDGQIDRAVCPVRNTVMGEIPQPAAILAQATGKYRLGNELDLPVRHCLLGLPSARLDRIRVIHSQLPALDQCRQYLANEANNIQLAEEDDTALAAKLVSQLGRADHAAIASRQAGELYGLVILRADIQDDAQNYTTFAEISLTLAKVTV